MGGLFGGGSQKIKVHVYHLSMHYGLCLFPGVKLRRINLDGERVWGDVVGEDAVTAYTAIDINVPDLWGGSKKEGGAVGTIHFFPGNEDQVLPNSLAARFGLTGATAPGFRRFASVFFVGNSNSGTNGFQWKTNTPYIPPAEFLLECPPYPETLDSANAMIGLNANPIHMIYECLTSLDFGMAGDPASINTASFLEAAAICFTENLGLSIEWRGQSSIESFVDDLLGHVNGIRFVHPATGQHNIKLIRNDYDPMTLETITDDDITITNYQKLLWGETINEMIVTWTSPKTEQDETVTLQDLGNIAVQGQKVTDTRNYFGVRSAHVALQLCARELRAVATPLAKIEAEANRTLWNVLPGKVVKVTSARIGITNLICRVMTVDYGEPGDDTIKVGLTEDIFALAPGAYSEPPDSGWEDPASDPVPIEFVQPFTIPLFLINPLMDDDAPASPVYPDTAVGLLTATANTDTFEYDLDGEAVTTGGVAHWDSLGLRTVGAMATLVVPLIQEAQSTVLDWTTYVGVPRASVEGFAFLGPEGSLDSGMELVFLRSFDGTNWTIDRGVLDTVPRAWATGTPLWFLDFNSSLHDPRIDAVGEIVNYKLLSHTSRGSLALADAPTETFTATDRPWRPSRPANVKAAGVGFGPVDMSLTGGSGVSPLGVLMAITKPGVVSFPVTWSERNRLTETAVLLKWTDPTVTPETGQTTKITIMDISRVVLSTITGLTGTGTAVPISAFAGNDTGIVRVTSERDGFESLQGHEITLINLNP